MGYKVTIKGSGRNFEVDAEESLLDAGLRHGLSFSYGCRNGVCGACQCDVVDGTVEYENNEIPGALSKEDQAAGKTLLCAAHAKSDLTIDAKLTNAAENIPVRELQVTLVRKEQLNDDVVVLYLALPEGERMQYLAGQYINIQMEDGRRRAFSIANSPHDDQFIQLHVRKIEGGALTPELFNEGTEGKTMTIDGPHGNFFFREESSRPIVMLATGTGFGPVKALMEHIIAEGVDRPVHLFWGGRTAADLYMDSTARKWAADNANIHYQPVLSQEEKVGCFKGYVQDAALSAIEDFTDYEMYACGSPTMVHAARDVMIERGMSADYCYGDAFEWAKN